MLNRFQGVKKQHIVFAISLIVLLSFAVCTMSAAALELRSFDRPLGEERPVSIIRPRNVPLELASAECTGGSLLKETVSKGADAEKMSNGRYISECSTVVVSLTRVYAWYFRQPCFGKRVSQSNRLIITYIHNLDGMK